MNGNYPAKIRIGLMAAVALTASMVPPVVNADFDELGQQLRIQQHKSRFQLMLEQVQESARQRATASHTAASERGRPSTSVDVGDWTESLRLNTVAVTDPLPGSEDAESARRLRAGQAYDRAQRRILDHRQQRDALIAGPRSHAPAVNDAYAAKRSNLTRYKTQNHRLTLQRKLRR
jgi:hypothetical protein